MSAPGSAFPSPKLASLAVTCAAPNHPLSPATYHAIVAISAVPFRPVRTIGRAQTRQAVTARWAAGIRAEAEYVMPTCHRSYVLEEYPAGEVEQ
jgi:hypothetical protein